MKIVLDEISFLPRYLSAFEEADEELVRSGVTVAGAARRAEKAKQDIDDLRLFRSKLAHLLRTGSVHSLPGLRTAARRVPNCHHLTVGPWRGIFVVDPGNELTVGLIFSKTPHTLIDKIAELYEEAAQKYNNQGGDENSE